jgi:hypothetical protein
MTIDDREIRELFEENYEFLKVEGGHVITDFVKEQAFNQVLWYWKRNRAIAEKVTQTEVRLVLPEQRTPVKGIRYSLEGVVDIVREGEETWMYDLKTPERAAIEANIDSYRAQMNVYAHIWKGLRGNKLDDCALISTAIPQGLRIAIRAGSGEAMARELAAWDPVIPLGYSEDEVEAMIEDFGSVVEAIEDDRFRAPPPSRLKEKAEGERNIFAWKVCRNCDVRFSCPSFRSHIRETDKGNSGFRRWLDDYGSEAEPEAFIEGNLRDTD